LENAPPFLDIDSVLGLFAVRRNVAQPAFRRFVEAGSSVDDYVAPLARVAGF
jgi:hypothetical protein